MKVSVLFTSQFQQAWDKICSVHMPISELDKSVKIIEEMEQAKAKIIEAKDKAFVKLEKSQKKEGKEGEKVSEQVLAQINEDLNKLANHVDFKPSVKLSKKVLEDIKLTIAEYSWVKELFE